MGKNFQSQCKLNVCAVYFLKPDNDKKASFGIAVSSGTCCLLLRSQPRFLRAGIRTRAAVRRCAQALVPAPPASSIFPAPRAGASQ